MERRPEVRTYFCVPATIDTLFPSIFTTCVGVLFVMGTNKIIIIRSTEMRMSWNDQIGIMALFRHGEWRS